MTVAKFAGSARPHYAPGRPVPDYVPRMSTAEMLAREREAAAPPRQPSVSATCSSKPAKLCLRCYRLPNRCECDGPITPEPPALEDEMLPETDGRAGVTPRATLEWLDKHETITAAQLFKACDGEIGKRAAKSALARMTKQGVLQRVSPGVYALAGGDGACQSDGFVSDDLTVDAVCLALSPLDLPGHPGRNSIAEWSEDERRDVVDWAWSVRDGASEDAALDWPAVLIPYMVGPPADDELTLSETLDGLREVYKGSDWAKMDDPLAELHRLRHGDDASGASVSACLECDPLATDTQWREPTTMADIAAKHTSPPTADEARAALVRLRHYVDAGEARPAVHPVADLEAKRELVATLRGVMSVANGVLLLDLLADAERLQAMAEGSPWNINDTARDDA